MTAVNYELVPEDKWEKEGVPHYLQRAVRTLNEALAISPLEVTSLLDTPVVISGKVETQILAHPRLVVGECRHGSERTSALRALGLLNAAIMEPPFCIYAQESREGLYELFGIYKQTP
jgi:hypothetical protein